MGIFDEVKNSIGGAVDSTNKWLSDNFGSAFSGLIPAQQSQWQGLSPHLIATFYPVVPQGEGKDRRFVKHGMEVIKAPILEGAEMEYTLNWQSPFEQMGTEAKAPALTAMLQSGVLSQYYSAFMSKINGNAPEAAKQANDSVKEMLKTLEGRTGITKLNSTQTFAGMPPIKCTMKLLFRAFYSPQTEVMQPIETLLKWAVPQELSPDGTLVRLLNATTGDNSYLDVLMPSRSPTLIAMEYKGRVYSPMVIEAISDPITSPTTRDGKYAKAEMNLTLSSLSAWDKADLAKIFSKGML